MEEFEKGRENAVSNSNYVAENVYGVNEKMDQPFVMNDVSALADKSNNFASFLTISQKFKYKCVYIFHIIYPEKSIME